MLTAYEMGEQAENKLERKEYLREPVLSQGYLFDLFDRSRYTVNIVFIRGRVMRIYSNPDTEGFSASVRSKIYIDKAGLIDHINQIPDMEEKFVSVSRPRRFGKSITTNRKN